MDMEDFVLGFFLITGGILILGLVILGICVSIKDISRDNNIKDYQKCICEKID